MPDLSIVKSAVFEQAAVERDTSIFIQLPNQTTHMYICTCAFHPEHSKPWWLYKYINNDLSQCQCHQQGIKLILVNYGYALNILVVVMTE